MANDNIKTIFDNRLEDNYNQLYYNGFKKRIKRTEKFYNKKLVNSGKELTKCSSIYKNLCLNYVNNKKIHDTVSYIHKDGTIHKGIILENSQILVINDPKLSNIVFESVVSWVKELDDFLPVVFIHQGMFE